MAAIPLIVVIIAIAAVALVHWRYIADLDYSQDWSREKSELSAAGRWQELNDHFEQRLKCRRPLLYLFDRKNLPGNIEAQYALHLYHQGHLEKALALLESASRKGGHKTPLFLNICESRALILNSLGRYEEARQATARAKSLNIPSPMADVMEGMIDMNNGLLDAALARIPHALIDPVSRNVACQLASSILSLKGSFQEAIDVLHHKISDVSVYFTEEDYDIVAETKVGRELISAMDKDLAGITRPGPLLGIAQVCLDAGDAASLSRALDKTQMVLQSHPTIEHIYHRLRACDYAFRGDAQGTESNLAKAREHVEKWPSRSGKYETHLATGRAQLILGQPSNALSELRQAIQVALHPLEKHTTNYWLGRAAEAANEAGESARHYNAVITQNFPTRMTTDARRRLDPTAPQLVPPPRQLSIET